MPIYAYRCAACGHSRDVLQKLSDPLLTVCPVCGAPAFEKQVTAAGFQLKGSGWYVTDFRNNGAAPPAAPVVPKDGASATAEASGGEGAKTGKADDGSKPAPAEGAAKTSSPAPESAPSAAASSATVTPKSPPAAPAAS